MEALGDVEELGRRGQDLPLDLEPDVGHQRHERVEDLGDAAAERGRVDVQHALAAQPPGELLDLGHELAGDDGAVVGELLVTDVDLAHKTSGSPARPARSAGRRPRRPRPLGPSVFHHRAGEAAIRNGRLPMWAHSRPTLSLLRRDV